jgi:serine/threonine protein kinase
MDSGQLKIGDLGFSKNVSNISKQMSTFPGTASYMSPEIIRQEKDYTNKVDVWSLGCVIYELVTLDKLFKGTNDFEIQMKIVKNDKIFYPGNIDANLKKILKG